MFMFARKSGLIITFLTSTFLLVFPDTSLAVSDEEIAGMRLQLQAMSERLDKLEAENRKLVATNAELRNSVQAAPVNIAQPPRQSAPIMEGTAGATAVSGSNQPQTAGIESSWADRIRWQGDFRYRYENIDLQDYDSRNRSRIRARAALIANITPDLQVGFGLASGGDDPVSSNQTLGSGGSSKGLALDLAYFDWSALENTHIYGGKFKNVLYKPGGSQLLWDSDWRPEGTAVSWNNDMFFAEGLGTWIESDSDKQGSFAYALQAGINLPIGDTLSLTAGAGYHVFDVQGRGSIFGDDEDFYGNSFNPLTQTYLYNYEELEVFANLAFEVFSRPLLFYADYVQNQAADDNNKGYILGFNFGKANRKGQWEIGYAYEKLEADAVFGLLTNSDFGVGGTDAKGSILGASYALHNGVNAGLTYFITQTGLKSGSLIDANRLQLDLNFKYK